MAVMPRFVLLYHDCPPNYPRPSHWDLMLETGDMLRTWALEQLPCDWEKAHVRTQTKYSLCPPLATGNDVEATQLGDHRHEYLNIEGDLTDNRGSVFRVVAGTYDPVADSPNCLEISIRGDGNQWQLRLTRASVESLTWKLESRTVAIPS